MQLRGATILWKLERFDLALNVVTCLSGCSEDSARPEATNATSNDARPDIQNATGAEASSPKNLKVNTLAASARKSGLSDGGYFESCGTLHKVKSVII